MTFDDEVTMRNLFPGHFKENDVALKKVWNECIFVFDANILLNFYRYSDSTRKEFLNLLSKIRGRVWLPYRAAEEYLDNRLSVIDQQEKSYDGTINAIDSLKKDLDNARQHPFVSENTMNKVREVFSLLCNELKENKSLHTKRISDDEIQCSISSIFENSVGLPYTRKDLEKIIVEGEERYSQKIPPGFKDGAKSGDLEIFSEKCRKYGDLIVWYQVIAKSKEADKSVILVTDDKKEDWWQKFKGKTVGPRPELVKEFRDETGNEFYMYQADRFLELARENLNERVSDSIVEEIREVRRRDRMAYKRNKELMLINQRNLKLHHLTDEIYHLRNQMMAQKAELGALQEKRNSLEVERERLREHRGYLLHEEGRNIDTENLMRNFELISEDYDQVRLNIDRSKEKYNEMQRRIIMLEQEISIIVKNYEQENILE